MSGFEQFIFDFMVTYSSQPLIVYLSIIILMTAGSFGFPISEEIVIIAAGLIAFVGSNPSLFPESNINPENTVTISMAATVCFLSVFSSDILVYCLGRFFSNFILSSTIFHRFVSKSKMNKISKMVLKNRYYYPAIFRLTPGLRFPGHFSSGFFRIPFLQFAFVDGMAALLIVPTQVILIGYLGKSIIEYLKEFVFFLSIFCLIFIGIFIYKVFQSLKEN